MYTVQVDDNYHYMDETERYTLGKYETWEEAVAAAKKLVDASLADSYKPGMSAESLYSAYKMFGEDPFILGDCPDPKDAFSAWDYAKRRCEELCGTTTAPK